MAEPRRQRDFDEGVSCTDEFSDDEVEVYVWNSLLQSYVFCPEDDTVAVAVEVGAHATGEADAVDRLASLTNEPYIDNGSLVNDLPSIHPFSSSQHALDIHPSPPLPPLHLQPDTRLDSFLPIIVEEPEIRHGVVYGDSSRTTSVRISSAVQFASVVSIADGFAGSHDADFRLVPCLLSSQTGRTPRLTRCTRRIGIWTRARWDQGRSRHWGLRRRRTRRIWTG